MDKEPQLELFKGCPVRRLYMPNGDKIVVTFRWGELGKWEELYATNHNVYRLNQDGEVVWQVVRDDSIMPPNWWETCNRLAREEGGDGHRIPFAAFVLEYLDGRRKTSDEHGDGTSILTWEPGCIIHLYGSGNDYVLDPETGVAKNVAKKGGRVW
jgi:hypothetical protein